MTTTPRVRNASGDGFKHDNPPRWKNAALSFTSLYPTVTAATAAVAHWAPRLPIPVRTLLIVGSVVPTMTYGIGPALRRLTQNRPGVSR